MIDKISSDEIIKRAGRDAGRKRAVSDKWPRLVKLHVIEGDIPPAHPQHSSSHPPTGGAGLIATPSGQPIAKTKNFRSSHRHHLTLNAADFPDLRKLLTSSAYNKLRVKVV